MTSPVHSRNATIREPLAVLAPRAIETAAVLSERVKGRDAQLRRTFLRRGRSEKPTPMMTMLRGGRGGEVRLKLYLSLLWIAVAPPHNVSYPARTWAALVGLPDPPGRGARRVNDALRWLSVNGFVEIQGEKGVPPIVTVRNESGDGSRYSLPGSTIKRLQLEEKPWNRHAYEKVPVQLWTNGWMAALDGPALACLLVLRSVPQPADAVFDVGAWFSPSLLRDRYDMSDDTRKRGMRRLQELGIVKAESRVLARTSADFQRSRTEYHLQTATLNMLAQSPLLATEPHVGLGPAEAPVDLVPEGKP